MNRILLAVTVVVVVGATISWMVQHQTQVELREEKESLQQQLEKIGELEADNQRLSNLVAQAEESSKQNLEELLRLRSEVGMLRRQTNEVLTLRTRNEQLQTAMRAAQEPRNLTLTNSPAVAPPLAVYPRTAWAFAGFASPETALQSLNWAVSNGDLNTLLANCTPDMQKELAKHYGDAPASVFIEEKKNRLNQNTEIRLLSRQVVSDSEVVLEIVGNSEGMNSPDKVVFQRMDGQWKLAPTH